MCIGVFEFVVAEGTDAAPKPPERPARSKLRD
jgi:hypothetical protein